MKEQDALVLGNTAVDPETWPQLVLNDATVYLDRKDEASKVVDLFDVIELGSLRIVGTLGPVKSQWRRHVLPKINPSKQPFEIPGVNTYSVEMLPSGEVIIWALGRCAWYQLKASSAYEEIFAKILEKGRLWIYLLDKFSKYSGNRKAIKGTVRELHKDYAKKNQTTEQAAAQIFEEHRSFLIMKMNEPVAETDLWQRTPIYREFHNRYKTEWKRVEQLLKDFHARAAADSNTTNSSSIAQPSPSIAPPSSSIAPPSLQNQSSKMPTTRRMAKLRRGRSAAGSGDAPPTNERTEVVSQQSASNLPSSDPITPVPKKTAKGKAPMRDESETEQDDDLESNSDQGPPAHMSHSSKGKSVLRPVRAPSPLIPIDDGADLDEGEVDTPNPVMFASLKHTLDTTTPAKVNDKVKRFKATNEYGANDLRMENIEMQWPPLRPGRGPPPIRIYRYDTGQSLLTKGKWTCSIDNCRYEVTTQGVPGYKMIEDHYEEHRVHIEKVMEVIGLEAPPKKVHHVDNLLAKIEEMAEQWAKSKPPMNHL
ncbi:hypothetical protein RUND412_001449 [Rhizina undulata]